MPKGGCSKTPQPEDFSLSNDMVEKQTGKKDKDKVSLTKTPKLDRSDGGKEVKERATKRKLPFTVGTNGDQKDSDTGTGMTYPTLKMCTCGLRGAHSIQCLTGPRDCSVRRHSFLRFVVHSLFLPSPVH